MAKNKIDFSHVNVFKGLAQIPVAINLLIDTPMFIKDHKLWKGFLNHKWVLLFAIVVAFAYTSALYHDLHDYLFPSKPNISSELEAAQQTANEVNNSLIETDIVKDGPELIDTDESSENHKSVFSGSLKFLLLIFLEVLIFHFAVKTNNILKKEKKALVLKDFIKAEKRLILVMARNWIFGLLMYILVAIACSIAKIKFLSDEIMFVIYAFYLGFAFLDNYLEQFNFSIKKSTKTIQKHFGAAVVMGLFASIAMQVPLIGPLAVPFICAIAATRYGHQMKMENFVLKET